jgi:hypothetical protein
MGTPDGKVEPENIKKRGMASRESSGMMTMFREIAK